jgi:hypothetical protein
VERFSSKKTSLSSGQQETWSLGVKQQSLTQYFGYRYANYKIIATRPKKNRLLSVLLVIKY